MFKKLFKRNKEVWEFNIVFKGPHDALEPVLDLILENGCQVTDLGFHISLKKNGSFGKVKRSIFKVN